jgi:hypothetical protein
MVAESKSIPIPDNVTINTAIKGDARKFKDYLGAWIIQGRWGGGGRQSLLIVQGIDGTGGVSGIYAGGPPTPTAFFQTLPSFSPFSGTISDAGLAFVLGDFRISFALVGETLAGHVEGLGARAGADSRANFERIP